ncbi:MAG: bifunctional folylpolyglutamate synthase/dihydrofolate synthase [Lachnospiraceae bacterium]|nr:bifunctional folylpolyglutamate synthase/dihydrofolate synthase [Lachnospiraceae bacterium]
MEEIFTTYGAAESYINATPKFTSKNSCEDTRRFLVHLGAPSQDKRILHVAGTNGKGSVCAYLCSVLQKAGISCGMFTSPHLVSMRERFRIDGSIVSEERFLWAFQRVMEGLKTLPESLAERSYHPTFFEFLFFMAMLLFEEAGVEYVVLETGLGGRLDATNAIERKEMCIITSIGYDHTEFLGDTLAEIAGEKAGILRKNVPVVYAEKQEEVTSVIEAYARKTGAISCPLEEDAIKEIKIRHKTIDFSLHLLYYDYIGFTVSTSALYQVENASLALRALALLREERITVAILQEGIREASWEGRMEEILPSVYVDGAHNTDGIRAFLETVRVRSCEGKRILLYSSVRDKRYREAAAALSQAGLFDRICPVQMQGERALPLTELVNSFRQYTGFDMEAYDTLEEAFAEQISNRKDRDEVYIVGSLYLAGELKALLRRSQHDQF